jgi:hypothetical protein
MRIYTHDHHEVTHTIITYDYGINDSLFGSGLYEQEVRNNFHSLKKYSTKCISLIIQNGPSLFSAV